MSVLNVNGGSLFDITKRRVIEDLQASFETFNNKKARSAIKSIEGGKYDDLLRESLSSKVTELADLILDLKNI